MRFFPKLLRGNTHCLDKLAGFAIIGFAMTAASAAQSGSAQSSAAQQPDDTRPEPPPAPAIFQNHIPAQQLAFLNDYAGRTAKEIQKDKRFRALMKLAIPRTEYHYGRDMPLSETVETLLDGAPMPIDIRDGRYAMVASHGGPYLSGKGFLWFDMRRLLSSYQRRAYAHAGRLFAAAHGHLSHHGPAPDCLSAGPGAMDMGRQPEVGLAALLHS